jgi:hypothetical protein
MAGVKKEGKTIETQTDLKMEMISKFEQMRKTVPVGSSFGEFINNKDKTDTTNPNKQDVLTHGNSSTGKQVNTPINLGRDEEKALIEQSLSFSDMQRNKE